MEPFKRLGSPMTGCGTRDRSPAPRPPSAIYDPDALLAYDEPVVLGISSKLGADSEVRDMAWSLYEQFFSSGSNIESEYHPSLGPTQRLQCLAVTAQGSVLRRPWMAAVLFVGGKSVHNEGEPSSPPCLCGFTITELLTEFEVTAKDFFCALRGLCAVASLGLQKDGWEQRIRGLEQRYVSCTSLRNRYVALFEQVTRGKIGENGDDFAKKVRQFGWDLLMLARSCLRQSVPGVVGPPAIESMTSGCALMVAVVHLLALHTIPAESALATVRASLESAKAGNPQSGQVLKRSSDGSGASNSTIILPVSLVTLCRNVNVSVDEGWRQEVNLHRFIGQDERIFAAHSCAQTVAYTYGTEENSSAVYIYDDLLTHFFEGATSEVSERYNVIYHRYEEFDERRLLDNPDVVHKTMAILTPSCVTPVRRNIMRAPYVPRSALRSLHPNTQSPAPSIPAHLLPSPLHPSNRTSDGTPGRDRLGGMVEGADVVSIAMECMDWLSGSVAPHGKSLASCLTAGLRKYVEILSPANHEDTFVELVSKYIACIPLSGEGTAHRTTLIAGLYAQVLEKVLQATDSSADPSGPPSQQVSALMTSDTFHKGIIACAAEVVVFCHRVVGGADAPESLQWLDLRAWDMFKVLPYFLKHVPDEAPYAVTLHMRLMENRLVGELLWRSSDRLVGLLAENSRLASLFKSRIASVTAGEHASRYTTRTAPDEGLVEIFVRKLLHLASTRILDLCSRLGQGAENLMGGVYSLFKLCLERHRESLFVDRDIDVVMLCCVYCLGRIHNMNTITFKRICDSYKVQPQFRPMRPQFRNIPPITQKQKRSGDGLDIIRFYNVFFVPIATEYISMFSSGPDVAGQSKETPCILASMPQFLSPRRPDILGSASLGGTPMTSMTPRTRQLYAAGESPMKPLRSSGSGIKRQLLFNQAERSEQKRIRTEMLARTHANLKRMSEDMPQSVGNQAVSTEIDGNGKGKAPESAPHSDNDAVGGRSCTPPRTP